MKKQDSKKPSPSTQSAGAPAGKNVQGEGDYEAARRYRGEVEKYLQSADIEQAAREAAPRDAREAAEMSAAEAAGRKRAKRPGAKPKPHNS
jgi:hypothetical protein